MKVPSRHMAAVSADAEAAPVRSMSRSDPVPRPRLRDACRTATRALHKIVDREYSRFDLAGPDGYLRFLLAHRLAAERYQPVLSGFARRALGASLPDFAAMVGRDMAALGAKPGRREDLPWRWDASSTYAEAGFAYVVLGARLGIAALLSGLQRAQAGAWVPPSMLFMTDRAGFGLWQAFLAGPGGAPLGAAQTRDAETGAQQGFALFLETAAAARRMELTAESDTRFHE